MLILSTSSTTKRPPGSSSLAQAEIVCSGSGKCDVLWVTGQNYDTLVKLATDGRTSLYSLKSGSGPHGMAFDAAGRLWLTLEFAGKVARLDENGNIVAEYNVCLNGNPSEINTRPHGLGIGDDGETIWFTGKATGTVGKIAPDGMWFTEMGTDKVGRLNLVG